MCLCFSESCGVLVAIALADMHECQQNKSVKRFNEGYFRSGDDKRLNFQDQPRSAFRFFMYNLFCIYLVILYFLKKQLICPVLNKNLLGCLVILKFPRLKISFRIYF